MPALTVCINTFEILKVLEVLENFENFENFEIEPLAL